MIFSALLLATGCAHSGAGSDAVGPAVGHDQAFSRSGKRNAGTYVVRTRPDSSTRSSGEAIDYTGPWGDGGGGAGESDGGSGSPEVPAATTSSSSGGEQPSPP